MFLNYSDHNIQHEYTSSTNDMNYCTQFKQSHLKLFFPGSQLCGGAEKHLGVGGEQVPQQGHRAQRPRLQGTLESKACPKQQLCWVEQPLPRTQWPWDLCFKGFIPEQHYNTAKVGTSEGMHNIIGELQSSLQETKGQGSNSDDWKGP